MSVVDKYLEDLPIRERMELERIRQIVHKYYPDARETISYGMPAFKYDGKYLVAYWAFKDHMSIFPTSGPIEALGTKLVNYTISKDAIQFTMEHPCLSS